MYVFRLGYAPASDSQGLIMAKSVRKRTDEDRELRAILTRVNPEGLKALKLLALEQDTSLQAVCIEAFNDMLAKHGRRAVVKNPLL
jgi:hypothetical protein